MKQKQKSGTKLLSVLLTLVMLLSLAPSMGLTAWAEGTETLLTTITPTGKNSYDETQSGVVTVTHDNSDYMSTDGWHWNSAGSVSVTAKEGYTVTRCDFICNYNMTVTDSDKPFEIHFDNDGKYKMGTLVLDCVASIQVYGYAVTSYPLWVGGVQVTSENADDVLGSADEGATVTYTPAAGTTPAALTLNNANITKGYPDTIEESGIYYNGADALEIVLAEGSDNIIAKSEGDFKYCGIYSADTNAAVTISGTGKLTAKGSGNGIKATNNLTINGGNVSAIGVGSGINAANDVTIKGGTVNATATYDGGSHGIIGGKNVTIEGGDVTAYATGSESDGIKAYEGIVNISGGNVIASGKTQAIVGNLKNSIAGTGWTNTEGTEGQAEIAVNTTGQTLSYKKVQFTAVAPHTHDNITFTAWDRIDSLPTSGNYYLTGNVTVNSPTAVSGTLNLCLNGYGILMTGDDRVFYVPAGATMNLYDCNESNLTHYVTLSRWRGTAVSETKPNSAEVNNGTGVVEVKGGFVTGGHAVSTGGGAFRVEGTFTMYGGTLLGNIATTSTSASSSGGAIWSNGTTTIAGSSRIAYNSGTDSRGGVYSSSGTFNISGAPDLTGNRGFNVVMNGNDRTINFTDFDPNARIGLVYYTTNPADIVITSGAQFNTVDEIKQVLQYAGSSTRDLVCVDGQAKIVKKPSTPATVTPNDRTYDGTEQPLVTADDTTLVGGTMQYALGNEAEATEPYAAEIPTGTDAGTYYVWYKVVGDANHTDSDAASATVTVAKADPDYTVPTGLTATCGDTLADVALPDGWAWADGTQSVGNVGTNTFEAIFTPADTDNYNIVENIDVEVTVDKAAGDEAVISTDTVFYTFDSIEIEGVTGQEYIIVPKGTEVTEESWSEPVLPDPQRDNRVFFEGLTPATEYEIYTRVAETETSYASAAVSAPVYTTLSGIGWNYDSALVGATMTVVPEPETEGLTYKWYQNDITEDEEGALHYALTEIPGASGDSYTFRAEDVGKYITVKIYRGTSEVGDTTTAEPVAFGTVRFDSMGGSKVEEQTGLSYLDKVTKPADPTRDSYDFDGWYWDEDNETPWDFEQDGVTWTETTLYAKWTPAKAAEPDKPSKPAEYGIASVAGVDGGSRHEWTKGSTDDVVITVKLAGEKDDSFAHFVGVKLDGKTLVRDADYTAREGSTIVTFKPPMLEKLSVGEHTVTVLFDNGEVSTVLTIKAAPAAPAANTPKTGDSDSIAMWTVLMSAGALAVIAVIGKKKSLFER